MFDGTRIVPSNSTTNGTAVLVDSTTNIRIVFHQKNLIPTVSGSVICNVTVWDCLAALGLGQHKFLLGILQRVLGDNVKASVRKLKLIPKLSLEHDNDSKYHSKSAKDWIKNIKGRVLEWPSQSLDQNPIEMLWMDLKWAVHVKIPQTLHN